MPNAKSATPRLTAQRKLDLYQAIRATDAPVGELRTWTLLRQSHQIPVAAAPVGGYSALPLVAQAHYLRFTPYLIPFGHHQPVAQADQTPRSSIYDRNHTTRIVCR